MLEDIKHFVKKIGESNCEGRWYFIIKEEFADGIDKWLNKYTNSNEGSWLDYTLEQSQNEEFMYVLILIAY